MEKHENYYKGEITLDKWNTFFGNDKPCGLFIDCAGDLTQEHLNGYKYIIDNQKEVLDAILSELLKRYPEIQLTYDFGYSDIERAEVIPDVESTESFCGLISPLTIIISEVSRDGMPYIGCDFSCSWDQEHGFGAMMYKDRVVEIGGGDTAVLSWIAQRDLDIAEQFKKEFLS